MLARIIGTIVIILVLYAIITAPQQAAATTSNGASALATAGEQITTFVSGVVNNLAVSTGSTTTTSGTHTYPYGGVETGDGSTPIDPAPTR
jgi:hypothetical protein